ncbi:MAG: methyltransferase domain-containing protein [Eubacteriales bacterium]|nr:methyltransferase domain-containing protein [Eubacteriales bacterium]
MTTELVQLLNTDEAAQALSALCAEAKSAKGRAEIVSAVSFDTLCALAKSTDAKTRKNAYRLIGALERPEYVQTLRDAIKSEQTMFCIPSLLLALGSLKDAETLNSYSLPQTDVEKHQVEIALALSKALNLVDSTELKSIITLDEPRKILCYAPKGFETCLLDELAELGFDAKTEGEAVAVKTERIARIMKARCLYEALIPIKNDVNTTPREIAIAVGECIGEQYRIELRGYTRDRAKLISGIAALIGGRNNPSNYDCELRIECHMDKCDLFWKLWNVPDNRFSYRKQAISASMQPSTAAAIVRYVKKFERVERPVVLDPFCGSGTLLFEREKLSECALLLGVDKSGAAIEAARTNAKAGKSKASFVCKDALRFEAREGADLIISNLPFGNRVGTHKDNMILYRSFCHRILQLLKPNGVAALYTMEYRLLEESIKREPKLRLLDSRRTEAGGLLPWLFILVTD